MSDRPLLGTTVEPRGLRVSLSEDVWEHIRSEHPEFTDYSEAIQLTVEDPDEIYFDALSSSKRKIGTQVFAYYRSRILAGVLGDNFVYVSVKFVRESSETYGYVQTAFATHSVQKRMELEWKK